MMAKKRHFRPAGLLAIDGTAWLQEERADATTANLL
jgi:hypothetical protein